MGRKAKVKAGLLPSSKYLLAGVKDGLVLSGVRELPDFAGMVGFPKYQGPLDKMIAGGLLSLFKSGGKTMFRVGVSEGVADLIDDFVKPLAKGIFQPKVSANGGRFSVSLANPLAARA